MDHFCYSFHVFIMLSRLFIAALWSPAGKGRTSWLLFVMSKCDFVTFPSGILCQLWYWILSIPGLYRLSYLFASWIIGLNIFILNQFIQYNTIFNHTNIKIRTEAKSSFSPLQYFDKVYR